MSPFNKFAFQKYGFFAHYVRPLTKRRDGGVYATIDELTDAFDAKRFAKDMAAFGVEYVIFTAWHFNAEPLYPSLVSRKWRDERRKLPAPKSFSDRDIIADLIDALRPYNIDLHLYTHPVDGHDFSDEDKTLTGWLDPSDHFKTWNDYINELYDELCARYTTNIHCIWMDGVYHHNDLRVLPIDHARLRQTLTRYNPDMALVVNTGHFRNEGFHKPYACADYSCWEVSGVDDGLGFTSVQAGATNNSLTWPGTKDQVALVVGKDWMATTPDFETRYTPKQLFHYALMQASISQGGGLVLAAGPFPGHENLWEGKIEEELKELAAQIAPIRASICGTRAGKAYVTFPHSTLSQRAWGVSTESADGEYVYLHIIKPPQTLTLTLMPTDDGSRLEHPVLFPSLAPCTHTQDAHGTHHITLPDHATWDALDTVIRMQRCEA